MTKAVIIDYGSGNLRSAAKAFERAAREASLPAEVRLASHAGELADATHIVLPGVGAFADCKAGLEALPGMVEALEATVRGDGRPFLGICVGMQLMAARGLEHGTHAGLGWIPGTVEPLGDAGGKLKIPHMGWNELEVRAPAHPLLAGLPPGAHAYFVHSYHFICARDADIAAQTNYGGAVVAAAAHGNIFGCQFHPEKSQAAGLAILSAFLEWAP